MVFFALSGAGDGELTMHATDKEREVYILMNKNFRLSFTETKTEERKKKKKQNRDETTCDIQ